MNLEDHIASGGTHELETRADGWVRCGCGTWGHPGTFIDRRLREDIASDWQGACCWSVEAREWMAREEALRPAVLSNDPWERTEQMRRWSDIPDWRQARRRAYLAAWPPERQAEAERDARMGDRSKLDRMEADFAAIRALYPKPKRVVVINGAEWPLPEDE